MEKTELLVKKVYLSETGHACGSVCGFSSVLPKCVNLVLLQLLVVQFSTLSTHLHLFLF